MRQQHPCPTQAQRSDSLPRTPTTETPPALEPEDAARFAGLRYVEADALAIARRGAGGGFSYWQNGTRIRDAAALKRMRDLVIPPAWTDVRISADARSHIQAVGRDARGRKQFLYHPRWREVRDAVKYSRMVAFGEALPALRRRLAKDMALRGLPRERVLAAVVRLLEATCIRVGSEEYARTNRSFGLTTLRRRHVDVDKDTLHFHFRAKSGKECRVDYRDARAARIVRKCQELPGQELFKYEDEEGQLQQVSSEDVNDYLAEVTGQDFTAKDFRTWAGTLLAFSALCGEDSCGSEEEAKSRIVATVKAVARTLNNTPAVCRKSYIHPAVLAAYLDKEGRARLRDCVPAGVRKALRDMEPEEEAVLAFLRGEAKSAA